MIIYRRDFESQFWEQSQDDSASPEAVGRVYPSCKREAVQYCWAIRRMWSEVVSDQTPVSKWYCMWYLQILAVE